MGTSARQASTPRHPGGSGGVASFDGRTGVVSMQPSDVTGLGGALVPLPPHVFGKMLYADGSGGQFWGTPGAGAVASFGGRTGAVTLQPSDVTALGGTLLPTPPPIFGKTLYADGIGGAFWADSAGGAGAGVDSFNTRDGAVTLEPADITGLGGALVPPGGAAGKVLAKNSSTDFDYSWASAIIPAGGASGDVLKKNSSSNYDVGWGAGGSGSGITSFDGRTAAAATLQASDITGLGGSLVPLPPSVFGRMLYADGSGGQFWGAPPSGGSGGVTSFGGRTGAVSLQASDITALGGVLVPDPTGVAFGKQLTATGTGSTFWG